MPALQGSRASPLLSLTSITDERGTLVAVENGPDLPFPIERLFYIVGAKAPRGFHAHREQHQLLITAAGSCRVTADDGSSRKEHILARPDQGLHLAPLIWVELDDFSADCVLLVLASAKYEDGDYIRDYPAFLEAAAKRGTP